jgi:hypothetical protein
MTIKPGAPDQATAFLWLYQEQPALSHVSVQPFVAIAFRVDLQAAIAARALPETYARLSF